MDIKGTIYEGAAGNNLLQKLEDGESLEYNRRYFCKIVSYRWTEKEIVSDKLEYLDEPTKQELHILSHFFTLLVFKYELSQNANKSQVHKILVEKFRRKKL